MRTLFSSITGMLSCFKYYIKHYIHKYDDCDIWEMSYSLDAYLIYYPLIEVLTTQECIII